LSGPWSLHVWLSLLRSKKQEALLRICNFERKPRPALRAIVAYWRVFQGNARLSLRVWSLSLRIQSYLDQCELQSFFKHVEQITKSIMRCTSITTIHCSIKVKHYRTQRNKIR